MGTEHGELAWHTWPCHQQCWRSLGSVPWGIHLSIPGFPSSTISLNQTKELQNDQQQLWWLCLPLWGTCWQSRIHKRKCRNVQHVPQRPTNQHVVWHPLTAYPHYLQSPKREGKGIGPRKSHYWQLIKTMRCRNPRRGQCLPMGEQQSMMPLSTEQLERPTWRTKRRRTTPIQLYECPSLHE